MNAFREKVLQAIRICNEELNRLLVMIDNRQLPPKEERYLNSFAHAFTVWGWNMQKPTKIFVLLTELNNEFKKI